MKRILTVVGGAVLAVSALHAQSRNLTFPSGPVANRQTAQIAAHEASSSESSSWATVDSASAASPFPGYLSGPTPSGKTICGISHLLRCVEDLGEDDKGIFTAPLHTKPRDAYWLMPLGAATGLAFAYDTDAQQAAGVDQNRTNTANTIADFGSFYATGFEGAGIYFLGLAEKNPKLAETGRLAAEAVIDSGTVTLATKLVSNRQRPLQGNGHGDFWANGTSHWEWDSSFPSDHATATMALARVVAGEYPHWYVMLPAYGFAETVSISRILANQHFPSDVIVGQAVGFLTGTYVLNHRALHRGNSGLTARVLSTASPITDPKSRTFGASVQIPITKFR